MFCYKEFSPSDLVITAVVCVFCIVIEPLIKTQLGSKSQAIHDYLWHDLKACEL